MSKILYAHIWAYAPNGCEHGCEHGEVIWQKMTKYGRGCPAGTGGHPESGTPSKVWSWALVCWSTAIFKGGAPPLKSIFARTNVHKRAQHVCFKRARLQGLLKVITCNLRVLPYRRNLGVIIFNGRTI